MPSSKYIPAKRLITSVDRTKLGIIFAIVLITILFSGCIAQQPAEKQQTTIEQTTTQPFCPQPYFEYKAGECCLDKNDNRICDKDEVTTIQPSQTTTTLIQTTTNPTTTQLSQTTTTITQTTTQPGQTTTTIIQQKCPTGYYDNDPNCSQSCPLGYLCRQSGVTVKYDGQTIYCYQCTSACPLNDPDYTYYYKNSICENKCNTIGGWMCFESNVYDNCYYCGKPCPDNYYYKDNKCADKCQAGTECTKSTQLVDCYWCKNPCPEGYYYKDSTCGGSCEIYEHCDKTTEECYLCVPKCSPGYYYKNSTCGNECDLEEACIPLTGQPDCYYCKATTTTTSHVTTTATPTTTEVTTTALDTSSSSSSSSRSSSIASSTTSRNSSTSSRGSSSSSSSSSSSKRTTTTTVPVCGNGVLEPGEQCEHDSDCPGYGYCDIDCKCYPDCGAYCDDQGVDGYDWINDGNPGSPVTTSQAQCTAWANQKLQQISQPAQNPGDPGYCKTSCVASAFYDYNGEYCCCVDWNQLDCNNCPCGTAPLPPCPVQCPSRQECLDTL